ncbi:hypothetical protein P885DRAFT_39478 [Corynascus similis CBS 632.67]
MISKKVSERLEETAGMARDRSNANNSPARRPISLPADFAPSTWTGGYLPAAQLVGSQVDDRAHNQRPTSPEQSSAPRPPTGTTSLAADDNRSSSPSTPSTIGQRRLYITPLVFRSRRVRCTRFSRYRGSRSLAPLHESPVEDWSPTSDDGDWEDVPPSTHQARRRSTDASWRRYSSGDSPRTYPRITDSIAPSPIRESSPLSERGQDADDEADDDVFDGPPEHPADRRASQASNPRLHLALQRPTPTALLNRMAEERAASARRARAAAAPPSIAEAATRAAAARNGTKTRSYSSSSSSPPPMVSNNHLPPGTVRPVGPNTRNHGWRISSGHRRKNKKKSRKGGGVQSLHLRWRADGYVTLSEGSSSDSSWSPGTLSPPALQDPRLQPLLRPGEVLRLGPRARAPTPPRLPVRPPPEDEEEKGKIPYQDADVFYP